MWYKNATRIFNGIKRIPHTVKEYRNRNNMILWYLDWKAEPNRVNLNWCSERRPDGKENIGDYLAVLIYQYMTDKYGIDPDKRISMTRHLYTVGSIIFFGYQDATVWGSGLLNKPKFHIHRSVDFRAVRGPETRKCLLDLGYQCPEVYGDPAVLMPLIYQPQTTEKTREYGVVLHKNSKEKADNQIKVLVSDYRTFIDEIVSCKKVISTSLYGIILAEVYGVPAVFLKQDRLDFDMMKYNDWYYSTGRYDFPVASSIEEALGLVPAEIPDFTYIQKGLMDAFPVDLWND